jgi:membrane protein
MMLNLKVAPTFAASGSGLAEKDKGRRQRRGSAAAWQFPKCTQTNGQFLARSYPVASRTASSLAARDFWKLWRNSFRDVLVDKGFTHAAAIAYYALVSMFPLLFLLIVIIGFLLHEDTADKIVGLAWPYLPASSLQLVRDNVTAVLQRRESISVLSFLGLLWSASLMFDAINEAVNSAWGVRHPERYVISKLKSFLMMTILLFFVMSSMAMTTQAALVGRRFDSLLGQLTALCITIGVFTVLYLYLPRLTVQLKDVIWGALQAGILWEILKHAFVWYLATTDFSKVYGSISAVLVLLIWMHVSALILIWGGEFSAEYARYRRISV